MFLKFRRIVNLTLAAVILLAPFSDGQFYSQAERQMYRQAYDPLVKTINKNISLSMAINEAKERIKKQHDSYASYLKSSGDGWKEMPYYKLTPAQVQEHLILTTEVIGDLLKGSSEYKEYQTGRWVKYGTIFVFFTIVSCGACAWLGPYFAAAGYTVGTIAGIGLPAVCSVEAIGASVFWSLMLSGSVIILTDVLKSTYDIFSARLFGQTYEQYLDGLKDKAVKPKATVEDMSSLFAAKDMPKVWENDNQHKQYLQLLYAFEAIAQELLGNNPNRYEMAWLDVMALAAGYDLPEDRTKLENFVIKKNKEYEEKKKQIRRQLVQQLRFDMFEGRSRLGIR
ncbi:MAG: hypothetical protein LBG46_00395 [Elusimicrobiota bacterium]|jgi:hypothetical protein|nr:hypothetical protein [Elusimicrobiota bacterium]